MFSVQVCGLFSKAFPFVIFNSFK